MRVWKYMHCVCVCVRGSTRTRLGAVRREKERQGSPRTHPARRPTDCPSPRCYPGVEPRAGRRRPRAIMRAPTAFRREARGAAAGARTQARRQKPRPLFAGRAQTPAPPPLHRALATRRTLARLPGTPPTAAGVPAGILNYARPASRTASAQ